MMPKSGCPFIKAVCGPARDITYQEDEGLGANGVPAGEVCAW